MCSSDLFGLPPYDLPYRPTLRPSRMLTDDEKYIVAEFVYDEGRGRGSLLSLALTSTAFMDICLRRLWRDIPNLHLLDWLFSGEEGNTWLRGIFKNQEVRMLSIPYECI